jgi:Zn-dependent protease
MIAFLFLFDKVCFQNIKREKGIFVLNNLGTEIIKFLRQLLVIIPGLYLGVVLHEVAHGYIAYRNGDPTARNLGRLTLNPIAHIDLFGSIILPLLLILTGSGIVFGYAKPVPINPGYFRNYRKGIRYSSLAGPATNFILAFILGLIYSLMFYILKLSGYPISEMLTTSGIGSRILEIVFSMVSSAISINIILGIFNFIPIPPLDGANILATFLPGNAMYKYLSIGRFGFMIVFALIYFINRFSPGIFIQPIRFFMDIFTWPLRFI